MKEFKKFPLLIFALFLFFSCSSDEEEPVQYNLTASASPSEGGSVSISSGSFEEGSLVTLQATPATGYSFIRWTGGVQSSENPVSVTMNAAKTITAIFEKQDSDGDGVPDDLDSCGGTPAGESVDENGCSESQKDSVQSLGILPFPITLLGSTNDGKETQLDLGLDGTITYQENISETLDLESSFSSPLSRSYTKPFINYHNTGLPPNANTHTHRKNLETGEITIDKAFCGNINEVGDSPRDVLFSKDYIVRLTSQSMVTVGIVENYATVYNSQTNSCYMLTFPIEYLSRRDIFGHLGDKYLFIIIGGSNKENVLHIIDPENGNTVFELSMGIEFSYAAIDGEKLHLYFNSNSYQIWDLNSFEMIAEGQDYFAESFYSSGFSKTYFYDEKLFYLTEGILPSLYDVVTKQKIVFETEGRALDEYLRNLYPCNLFYNDIRIIPEESHLVFAYSTRDCAQNKYGVAVINTETGEIKHLETESQVARIIIRD